MFQTFLSATKDDLKKASISLKQSTPVAMNTMLAKQPKEEAIKKKEKKWLSRMSLQQHQVIGTVIFINFRTFHSKHHILL